MLKVANWAKFQHYGKRRPPWIKLHRSLLDNLDWLRLPVASRALAPMLWLLASESPDASIPLSSEDLAFRLRISLSEVEAGLTPLIAAGFIIELESASTVLAERKQVATLETERETETEAEGETEAEARARASSVWEKACTQVDVPDHQRATWLRPTEALSLTDSTLTVRVPTEQHARWIRMNYIGKLQSIVAPLKLRFVLAHPASDAVTPAELVASLTAASTSPLPR